MVSPPEMGSIPVSKMSCCVVPSGSRNMPKVTSVLSELLVNVYLTLVPVETSVGPS